MSILTGISASIRNGLIFLLARPVNWAANRFSSFPRQEDVTAALNQLYLKIINGNKSLGPLLPIDIAQQKIIIFSDQHKGARNGSDDFLLAEKNYLAALHHYLEQGYVLISLGDSEELWENNIFSVAKQYEATFQLEGSFAAAGKFYKIYGNHDLFWDNDPFASTILKKLYGTTVPIYAGVVLRLRAGEKSIDVFCTHGHQGDRQSDGNAFSKWFVSYIWGPLQAYLRVNTNKPSANNNLKTLHNEYMYQWSKDLENLVLITGHTHQPVFRSLTHLERLLLQREDALARGDQETLNKLESEIPRREQEYGHIKQSFRNLKPSYFNTGCCCYADGNITGIEIADGNIRLVKWSKAARIVAEECGLETLA